MVATGFNHVSISALDLEGSVRFYTEVLGLERLPTPNFGFPVQWLSLGGLQLHLFERLGPAPAYHHLALTVDDFEAAYTKSKELGIFDREAFGHHIYELPSKNVQMYLRDPGGNLVEIDHPNIDTINRSVVDEIRRLPQPQGRENLRSTLFLAR
ncbi:MAG: VOC family protein [Candidatus Dormibacter sp.]|uniref:VOC family protein n=1 Tax=Candidatus Dormibacter sp. TaxID=2973982 RepID=UPI003D9AD679